jgi:hypothetical protein
MDVIAVIPGPEIELSFPFVAVVKSVVVPPDPIVIV